MKILFLDQFSELGGGQLCLLDLLPRSGWEAHAAAPGNGPLLDRLVRLGVAVHPLSLGSYTGGRKTVRDGVRFASERRVVAREIRELVERIAPDVVYVNGPRLMPLVEGPVVFHAHNRVIGLAGRLVRRAVQRTGATVIAASRFVWEGPGARVIYGGVAGLSAPTDVNVGRPPWAAAGPLAGLVPLAEFGRPGQGARRGPGGPPHTHSVGLVGRFSPQKGQKQFVQAAALLPPDWTFFLCGDAQFGETRYRDEVVAMAPTSVQHLGWRDDVYEVLSSLALLVVPSAGEGGVPRVILEAFAAGVPVLALNSGAIPEVVREGENGFLLRSAAPEEIARRLCELVPQRDRLAAVAAHAHLDWQERFTVERYRREIWDVIAAAARPTAAVNTSGPA